MIVRILIFVVLCIPALVALMYFKVFDIPGADTVRDGVDDAYTQVAQLFGTEETGSSDAREVTVSEQMLGNWIVSCQDSAELGRECVATQSSIVEESGQRLSQARISKAADDEFAILNLTLPLGTSVPPGVELSIDGQYVGRLKLGFCDQSGCYTGLSLEPNMTQRLTESEGISLQFRSFLGQTVTAPVSLDGFSEAVERVGQE